MAKRFESEFIFHRIQIKSLRKARKFAKLLGEMEEEIGIRVCKITIMDSFVCPDIDLEKLGATPAERWVKEILEKIT